MVVVMVWGGGSDSSSSSDVVTGVIHPRSVWCCPTFALHHTKGRQTGDVIETIMRGGAVVKVVGWGGRGCGSGGMAAGSLLTGYLQGCWGALAAGSGSLGHSTTAASSTKNKLFIFLL